MVQYDIKGKSPDTDMDKVAEKVREKLPSLDTRFKMQLGVEIKPLFFGIKAAVAQFILPEEDGVQDKLEEWLLKQEGVADIELSFTTRL